MTVTLETSQMESAKRRAARKISERRSVPGFRPGKAPYDVMVRSFGEGVIVEEAVDLLLDEIYPKALEESKIEPGASGSLEKMEDLDKEPKFIFTIPLAPKVVLGDYRSVRVPYEWKEPTDEDVTKSLDELRQMYAKTETVERPIQENDFVMVDVKGVRVKAVEGEAPSFERTGFPVFIRNLEKTDEWPFPGFSTELLGKSKDEVVIFSHKFPKDHSEENLRGQTVKFEVNIKMVRGSILPELNDEFAKQLGPFENVQALRDTLKANLASRSKADYDDEFYTKVLDAIKANTVINYAPQTLEHELEHVMEDITSRLAKQNMDMAAYLKSREMDEEKFKSEEAKPTAIKRLERSLLMDELAKSEKIEVSKEQLDSTFQQTWYEMAGSEDFKKYMRGKAQPPKQMMNAVAMESANRAYLQQTLERLKLIATGMSPEPAEETPDGKTIPGPKPNKKASSTRKSAGPKTPTSASSKTKKKPASNAKDVT